MRHSPFVMRCEQLDAGKVHADELEALALQLVSVMGVDDARMVHRWMDNQREDWWLPASDPVDGMTWPGIVLVYAIVRAAGFMDVEDVLEQRGPMARRLRMVLDELRVRRHAEAAVARG